MSQRGGVGLYLLFSIVISIAAGYGVYHWIKEHPEAFASTKNSDETATTTTKPAKPTATKPTPVPMPPIDEPDPIVPEEPVDPMAAAMAIAESNAENPTPSDSDESPVLGTPGISGGIERGAVERRFKPRAAILQRCFQRSGGDPTVVRVSMQVAADGKVSHLTVSTGEDEFRQCVVSALNFTFSATKDGNPAAVVQPIAFR